MKKYFYDEQSGVVSAENVFKEIYDFGLDGEEYKTFENWKSAVLEEVEVVLDEINIGYLQLDEALVYVDVDHDIESDCVAANGTNCQFCGESIKDGEIHGEECLIHLDDDFTKHIVVIRKAYHFECC
ncbi:hypothetical protein HNV12_11890 [Methanococcoides sp. SA1]|nr:hypothetical protein [Methanococcoides sp. SA1]